MQLKQALRAFLPTGASIESLLKDDEVMVDKISIAGAGLMNGDLLYATIHVKPLLHCFNTCYLGELFERLGMGAVLGYVDTNIECYGMGSAPEVARGIAQAVADDVHMIVISNPSSNIKEACMNALKAVENNCGCIYLKIQSNANQNSIDDEGLRRFKCIAAARLTQHFFFFIGRCTILGGVAHDGSIVGYAMRTR